MKYLSAICLFLGLCTMIAGAIQSPQNSLLTGVGLLSLIFGVIFGAAYLLSLLERAMQAAVKASEDLAVMRIKVAAIEGRLPIKKVRISPAVSPTSKH